MGREYHFDFGIQIMNGQMECSQPKGNLIEMDLFNANVIRSRFECGAAEKHVI